MRKTPISRTLFITVTAAFLLFLGCGGPSTNERSVNNAGTPDARSNEASADKAVSSTCTAADDKQIVSQLRILIDEDPALKPHRKHINFSTKYCKVTLRGWVDSWATFQKLYEKINNAGGVRSIDIKGFDIKQPPAVAAEKCPEGTKPCGELCVPIDEDCTIPIGD